MQEFIKYTVFCIHVRFGEYFHNFVDEKRFLKCVFQQDEAVILELHRGERMCLRIGLPPCAVQIVPMPTPALRCDVFVHFVLMLSASFSVFRGF